jgi:hypothetical protein
MSSFVEEREAESNSAQPPNDESARSQSRVKHQRLPKWEGAL